MLVVRRLVGEEDELVVGSEKVSIAKLAMMKRMERIMKVLQDVNC